VLTVTAPPMALSGSTCDTLVRSTFKPQNKLVGLMKGSDARSDFILFRSRLKVNTDGAPTSYHSVDLEGRTLAINNIANAISITESKGKRHVSYSKTVELFRRFRDANWVQPESYVVHWQSVLASRRDDARAIPCVFKSGPYAGYFGSLTALKNGLTGDATGECEGANQLDERKIPALVIAGSDNPLKSFGAKVGDLVFAVNPANHIGVAAVIGDVGPPDNLGEGSVGLNMALLLVSKQPENYKEAKNLDTGRQEILIAIMPGTALYKRVRPYSAVNISSRVNLWLAENGYTSAGEFSALMATCADELH
jgi:hypothetical protein